MNVSHAYGTLTTPASGQGAVSRQPSILASITSIPPPCTASVATKSWSARLLHPFRQRFFLASKCGMTGVNGKRVIDGRPETLKQTCKEALTSPATDVIDLYYLHRWDKRGADRGERRRARRPGARRSHSFHRPVRSLRRRRYAKRTPCIQSRPCRASTHCGRATPRSALLTVCRELGVALVAFSPLARGFLANGIPDPRDFVEKDIRRSMPRFNPPHFGRNRKLLDQFNESHGRQAARRRSWRLAWLLAKAPYVLPIVGTTSIAHLEEDVAASKSACVGGHVRGSWSD